MEGKDFETDLPKKEESMEMTKPTTAIGMKIFLSLLGVFLLFSVGAADEKQKLNDRKDKESYSLGYQFGQSLKYQGLEINLDVYTAGIRDALGGKDSLMSQEEIRSTVGEVQKRFVAARQKELKEMAEKNLADSKTFMEENKKKDGVKTLPSGLQYKILVEGTGRIPKETDTVTVHYRGTLIGDKEIDNSYSRGKPQVLQVDKVVPGWTEALRMMKEGSKWQLFIPPELGYGEQGVGPIPPNSTLIFELELISIN
jgi:FKBP-type peptidyl-prolyl cis-trans isomerase FklB